MAMLSDKYIHLLITEELRALMLTKFCGYEKVQIFIEYGCLTHDYKIRVSSLVTELKKYLWFDADRVKNTEYRRLSYFDQLGLKWADPIC